MRPLLILLLSCVAVVARAQDTLAGNPMGHAEKVDFKFLLNFDARRTIVFDDPVRFFGIRLGAQRDKDIMALGFYGFDNPWIDHSVPLPDVGLDSTDLRTSLSYGALTYERVLYEDERWMLSVPVMVGIGHATIDYRDSTGTFLPYAKREVLPLEGGMRVAYKLFFWLYLQGGMGYRKVLTDELRADRVYTGITWNYGISIKTGKIFNYARDRIKQRKARRREQDGQQ